MTEDVSHVLQDLGIVLGTAALMSLVSHRLRQPAVFGHLFAGLLLGPHVLESGVDLTRAMSEFGVILLMFSLGVEFNLRKLARAGPSVGPTALLAVGSMFSAGYLLARSFGWPTIDAVFVGACVGISSTMFVAQAFDEQQLRGGFTEVTVAVLVFEDLLALVLLAVLTAVAVGTPVGAAGFALTLFKLVGFLAALLAVGLLVVPRFFRRVVGQSRPEATLVAGIAVCFIVADLAAAAGYSAAVGAFVAGLLLAESGQGARIEPLVRPLREIFGALFFIAVGMSIDPRGVVARWPEVLAFTVLVLVGKTLAAGFGAFLFGHELRPSVRIGMSLAQIGEFSFIIAALGTATGTTGGDLAPVVVGVSLLTTLVTPWMVRHADSTAARFEARLPAELRLLVALYEAWVRRVRSAPRSVWGRVRGDVLMLALDAGLLLTVLMAASSSREAVVASLRGRIELPASGVDVVWTAVTVLAVGFFFVRVLRRSATLARTLAELALPAGSGGQLELVSMPRRVLVASLEVVVLAAVGLPLVLLAAPFVPLRSGLLVVVLVGGALAHKIWHGVAHLPGRSRAADGGFVESVAHHDRVGDADRATPTAAAGAPGSAAMSLVCITAESAAVGQALALLRLPPRSGAHILTIQRPGVGAVLPALTERLAPGDVVTLLGTDAAIARARTILLSGPAIESTLLAARAPASEGSRS